MGFEGFASITIGGKITKEQFETLVEDFGVCEDALVKPMIVEDDEIGAIILKMTHLGHLEYTVEECKWGRLDDLEEYLSSQHIPFESFFTGETLGEYGLSYYHPEVGTATVECDAAGDLYVSIEQLDQVLGGMDPMSIPTYSYRQTKREHPLPLFELG